MKPACGPPKPNGTPKRWVVPTAMSAPCSPGGVISVSANRSAATDVRFVTETVPSAAIGTATTAEAADAALKLRSQGALSVEGMWDMLDWDEARKKLERERLDAELDTLKLYGDEPAIGA